MLLKSLAALSAASTLLMAAATHADTPARTESNDHVVQTDNPSAELGRPVFRASQLKGVKVKNASGEEVGKIHDLVIDARSGEATYVALSVGRFLGIGDKLFAIPYESFTFLPAEKAPARDGKAVDAQRAADDPAITATGKLSDVVAVLDISKETLQKAQGFDQKVWPNMVDASWHTANDRAYKSLHRRQLKRSNDAAGALLTRASELIGANVVNAKNETVGEINDLMIDDADGNVRYAALSVGGFLGMGAKLFAVPISALTITTDADGQMHVELPVTKESFKGIEGFDKDHWPDLAAKRWRDHNDQGYRSWPRRSN